MIFVYERDQRQNICCFVLNVTMVSADLVFNFTLGIATVLIIIAQRRIIVFPSYRPNLFPTSRGKSNRWWSRNENKNADFIFPDLPQSSLSSLFMPEELKGQ